MPSEAAEIAAAALAIVKPNQATMVYGTLTLTTSEEATRGIPIEQDDNLIEPTETIGAATTTANRKKTKYARNRTLTSVDQRRKSNQGRKQKRRRSPSPVGPGTSTKPQTNGNSQEWTDNTKAKEENTKFNESRKEG